MPKTRDLDIYRKPRHGQSSQFLHAMRLIAPAFAERVKGPDRVHGFRADILLETWTYAWSPAVEAALIERAADGETVRDAAATMLIRRLDDLEKQGQCNNAEAAFNLLSVAFDAGIGGAADRLVAAVGAAARADSNLLRLTNALIVGQALDSRARVMHSESTLQAFTSLLPALLDQLARRIAELLRDLAAVSARQRRRSRPRCLAALAEAMARSRSAIPDATAARCPAGSDGTAQLDPELNGAVIALAALIGLIDDAEAGRRLSAALAGISEQSGEAMRTIAGVMALAPQLVVRNAEVIAAIDDLFGTVDDRGFLALLPQLRMVFAELSPHETDRVAAIVAVGDLYGLGEDAMAQLAQAPDAGELSDHLALGESACGSAMAAGWAGGLAGARRHERQ